MSLTSKLFRAARIAADARAVQRSMESGSLDPVARRAKNKLLGRALGRAGVWRRLWR